LLKRILLFLVPVAAVVAWLMFRGTPPPEVPWTQAKREAIVSTLTTNGRVDPRDWAAVHAETGGPMLKLLVERGQKVSRGQVLMTVGSAEAQSAVTSAKTRVDGALAELETLKGGGRAPELAEIESGLAKARAELQTARTEVAALDRLVAKKAATGAELTVAQSAVRQIQLQMESLERRRAALVTGPDRQAAEARVAEARAGLSEASRKVTESQVRSPMDGIVYELAVRAGAYLTPGTLLAKIGKLSEVRVTVFVDEPELGRVGKGMPVKITWDALPAREWAGTVESVPLQIVSVGTRQVGEVICLISNEDLSLIAGTNVNAEIRSKAVDGALVVPKEVLRREGNETGVLTIVGDRLVWQKIRVGVASVTHVQVLEGLAESDRVLLPVEAAVKAGDQVRALAGK